MGHAPDTTKGTDSLNRMVKQNHDVARMSAVWLLPVVTLIVAASAGGLLATALQPYSELQALWTSGFSIAMVLIGLSLAAMIITVYLLRLIIHGSPDATLSLSAFLVLGPLGQGGYCMLINGQVLSELFPLHAGPQFPQNQIVGQMIFSICFCAAYALFSMAVAWILLACCSIGSGLRSNREPFSMAYWGLIFPNGVFALLLVQLGTVLNSSFFRAFGATWSGKFDRRSSFIAGRSIEVHSKQALHLSSGRAFSSEASHHS